MLNKETLSRLPHLASVNPNTISISGFSGGGFMASQLHFIYSNLIKGCGLVSGGPYSYFLERAKFDTPDKVVVPSLIEQTEKMIKD